VTRFVERLRRSGRGGAGAADPSEVITPDAPANPGWIHRLAHDAIFYHQENGVLADLIVMNSQAQQPAVKVLVVEDDAIQTRLVMTLLRRRGYAVVTASDGVQAMQSARRERPDLIMLDIGLPGGDGLLTLTRLRNLSETAATPVVISTSRTEAAWESKAMKLGADGFLPKPTEPERLVGMVDRLTRGPR